jgi:predicted aspartyl protease
MRNSLECGFSGPLASDRLTGEGPRIAVDIGFDPTWRAGETPRPPTAADKGVAALIDTGAMECYIDCDLAASLQLPVVDRREVAGSLGKHEVDVYIAQIFIPSLLYTQYGEFAGVYLSRGGIRYKVLMGRTFLARFTLVYNGKTGRAALTWAG